MEANKQPKKQLILEVFYHLVAEMGFENVSMAKIAKQIDIPTSLIFHYFKSKQNLTYALVDLVLEKCEASVLPTIDRREPAVHSAFIQYMDAVFEQYNEYDTEFTKVFFACHDLALRDDHVKEKFEHHQNDLINKYTANLMYFIERKVIAHDDPMLASAYLLVILDGIADRRDFSSELELDEKVKEEAKRQYIEYLGGK